MLGKVAVVNKNQYNVRVLISCFIRINHLKLAVLFFYVNTFMVVICSVCPQLRVNLLVCLFVIWSCSNFFLCYSLKCGKRAGCKVGSYNGKQLLETLLFCLKIYIESFILPNNMSAMYSRELLA